MERPYRPGSLVAAAELASDGLPGALVHRPSGGKSKRARRVSDAELEEALWALVGPLGYMPGATEFQRRFGPRVLNLIYRRGSNPSEWASRLGLEYRSARQRTYSDAGLEAELRGLLDAHEKWPGRSFFETRGKRALYNQVASRGGVAAWAKRLGLRWEQPSAWTDEELLKELKQFCAGWARS